MMKKLLAIALCALMIVASTACISGIKIDTDELKEELNELLDDVKDELPEVVPEIGVDDVIGDLPDVLAGGWQVTADFELTDEQKALFEKGLEGLVGANYVPIALLGTQVVAGTNYCFLAQTTPVVPDANPVYTLVFLYQDLEGNVQLMNVADLPIVPNEDGTLSAPGETLMGGWSYAQSYEITDELSDCFNRALEGTLGSNFTAIAQLGTQIVSGTNRCILAEVTPVVPDPQPHYALVYLYENLEGGAELLNIIDFDFGALCTYGE